MLVTRALLLLGTSALVYGASWGYSGTYGPDAWATMEGNAECAGRRQSPINIQTAAANELRPQVLKVTYPVRAPTNQSLSHNGHTIILTLAGRDVMVTGSTLETPMHARQIHFHAPSEHTINGKLYAAEVHMVTETINHALFETSRTAFAVVGILYDVGPTEDPLLTKILSAANTPTQAGQATDIEMAFDYDLPQHFYEYPGSLTTPPCWEIVHWMLGAEPRSATQAQIDQLASIMGVANNRPIMPRNSRTITKRKMVGQKVGAAYKECTGDDTASVAVNLDGLFGKAEEWASSGLDL